MLRKRFETPLVGIPLVLLILLVGCSGGSKDEDTAAARGDKAHILYYEMPG